MKASIARPFTYEEFPDGSHVDLEWDNLIILDACRYDLLRERNPFDAEVQKVTSNASHTTDFLQRNLCGDQYDTVYITASPQVSGHESRFYKVYHVWETKWDDKLRTVRPEDVTEAALKASDNHPNRRLIVHYMQPHYPFIGPTGQKLATHATFTGGLKEREYLSVWELLSSGKISVEKVRLAYEENLDIVTDEVKQLVQRLDGKTVITSDHGNLLGERVSPIPLKLYGHPPNLPAKGLIEVPLIELPYESRRKLLSDPPKRPHSDTGHVESRLEDLGYLQ